MIISIDEFQKMIALFFVWTVFNEATSVSFGKDYLHYMLKYLWKRNPKSLQRQ